MSSVNYTSTGQQRPTPIRLGTQYVLRRQVFVNDGTGRVLHGGSPGISLATLSIYSPVTTVPLTALPMNVITITNGQELIFTLGDVTWPLATVGEYLGEIIATRNGVPSETKQWYYSVYDLDTAFDNPGGTCGC